MEWDAHSSCHVNVLLVRRFVKPTCSRCFVEFKLQLPLFPELGLGKTSKTVLLGPSGEQPHPETI